MLICGIEEAGRGPVIGPMVMCGCVIKDEHEDRLKKIGVKDSKLLTPSQREKLFKIIKNLVDKYKLIIIPPAEIDAALRSDHLNLNWLEAQKSAEIITALKPDKVIIDCPSNNIKEYTRYIKNIVYGDIEIIAEHKADVNYPIVSAASILAKVTRDKEIEKIQKKVKVEMGSGYPSDPITQNFLLKYHDKYPDIIRKTWEPYQKIMRNKLQKKLGEY